MAYIDTPRYKLIMFGDGLTATLIELKNSYNNRQLNLKMVQMLIVPHRALLEVHNIPSNKLKVETPDGRGLWVEYPEMYVHPLTSSQSYGVVDILCDFYGNDTVRTQMHARMLEDLKRQQAETNVFKEHVAVLTKKLEYARVAYEEEAKNLMELKKIFADRGDEQPYPDMEEK